MFKRVGPGLYERIDTPKHVEISEATEAAIRAESPCLADILFGAPPATLERVPAYDRIGRE